MPKEKKPVLTTGSQLIERFGEIFGVWGYKRKQFAVKFKFQRMGMQGRTLDQVRPGGTVEGIAQQGEPQRKGMHPHLVCTPGSRNCSEERIAIEAFQDLEGCLGWFAFPVINNCPMAMTQVDTQRVAGYVFIPRRIANGYGMVELMGLVVFKEYVQFTVGLGASSEDDHAAGDFIQAVNNPDRTIFRFK